MSTINKVFYTQLKNDATMKTTFGLDSNSKANVYYIVNDKVKQPYATIWLVDDPKDNALLCDNDYGAARFQCDTFTKNYVTGINKREIFQNVVKSLQPITVSGLTIYQVDVLNVNDRANTVDGLFQFSFEAILYWNK